MSSSLFEELKRRNVYKVGVAYLVLAWVVVQVSTAAVPALHLPSWVNTVIFLFGIIGFPFALFFAWAFEITPDGVKRESDIVPEDSVTAHTGRKLDFVIIGLLVVALGYFIYESRFTSPPTKMTNSEDTSQNELPQKVIIEPKGSSIAVLPFVNMSSDPEQEYFSDGISEEILNVLAKIPKLHVTSRSSAFFYKGKDIKISNVAKELGVKNVLEGSVRKSGNRIRITAQLIEAGSDKHLWSETYDRELTDIFAVQDEISAAIVVALKTELGLKVTVVSRDMSKVNLDAHNEYLQGRFYIENRNQGDLEKALIHFNQAIVLAPDYALAWMGKGWAIHFLGEMIYGDVKQDLSLSNARLAIEKALILDPNLPEAYTVLGSIESYSSNPKKAKIYYQKAIELNPNNVEALSWYGNALFDQPQKRLSLYQKAIQLSPMSILANRNYAVDLISYGRLDEVLDIAKRMRTINETHGLLYNTIGEVHLVEGNYAQAIIAFETQIKNSPSDVNAKFYTSVLLSTIGFGEKAMRVLDGTSADVAKHWFDGNIDLYIKQVKETFPRDKNDSLGYWVRGMAESRVENYLEASKYFKLSTWDESGNASIFSNLRSGNIEKGNILLEKAKSHLNIWINAGAKFFYSSGMFQPIVMGKMEIANLEGDINKAMKYLNEAMKNNYIINFEYQASPMYKKLRAHSGWSDIMARSNERAAAQRELYIELKAKDEKDTF